MLGTRYHVQMRRAARQLPLLLFTISGASFAHALAYLLSFRCWSCHGGITTATHAAVAASTSCVLAVGALTATIVAGHLVRSKSVPIGPITLFVGQAAILAIFTLLDGPWSLSLAPVIALELILSILVALLLARFARVVEAAVVRAIGRAQPRVRASSGPTVRPTPGPQHRAAAYNATGFLRAPPLPV